MQADGERQNSLLVCVCMCVCNTQAVIHSGSPSIISAQMLLDRQDGKAGRLRI